MTGPHALVLVVVSLAAFRVARLITRDSITDPARAWIWAKAFVQDGWTAAGTEDYVIRSRRWWWLWELSSCPWCMGAWTSSIGYALWTWAPWAWLWHPATEIAAVAGLQAFLGSREHA